MTKLRIGTRQSKLALWQAEFVRDRLLATHSDLEVELVGIITQGDRHQEVLLSSEGGKGLFLKELEEALLIGRIDMAVHSMKDVTVTLPAGLHIPVICERGDPRDVLVSKQVDTLDALPQSATVGTCSLRRQCLVQYLIPGVKVLPIRGNVHTRLKRLDQGDFDAIILAAAGLQRLGLEHRIGQIIPVEKMLPAVGQGAIGIECRIDDETVHHIIKPLNHSLTHVRVRAERAANETLNSGCLFPVAFYAELTDGKLHIRGMVGTQDGSEVLFAEERGSVKHPESLGQRVAEALQSLGAERILSRVRTD
jgi:hydroxymethylbilane synthase